MALGNASRTPGNSKVIGKALAASQGELSVNALRTSGRPRVVVDLQQAPEMDGRNQLLYTTVVNMALTELLRPVRMVLLPVLAPEAWEAFTNKAGGSTYNLIVNWGRWRHRLLRRGDHCPTGARQKLTDRLVCPEKRHHGNTDLTPTGPHPLELYNRVVRHRDY